MQENKFLHAGLLGLFLLVLYLLTTSQTVTPEDSGMYILSSLTLGISHPSGYPLYVLLGHLFSYLPFESVAFRIHFFSALCAVGACLSLYWVLLQFKFKNSFSLMGALLFGLSQTLWYHAIVAEVYALNALFFFFLLGFGLKIQGTEVEEKKTKLWIIWALVLGLSISNHWPLIMLASPVFMLLFYKEWLPKVTLMFLMALALFVGLTPYLYLLMRSNPEFAFTGPIKNVGEWITYIRRSYYSDIDAESLWSLKDSAYFVLDFFMHLRFEAGAVGTLLAFGGIFASWKLFDKQKFYALIFGFLSSSVLLHFVLFAEYNVLRSEIFLAYHLVPYGLTCLYFVLGLTQLEELLSRQGKFKANSYGIVLALSILSVGTLGFQNFHRVRFGEHSLVNDYAKLVLSHVPKNSSLFVYGDTDVGPFAYTQYVERVRPDIEVFSQSGEFYKNRLFHPIKAKESTQRRKIEEYIKKKGIIYSTKTIAQLSGPETKGIKWKFHGLFHSYFREDYFEEPEFQLDPKAIDQAFEILDRSLRGKYSTLWQYHRDVVLFRICSFIFNEGKDHPLSKLNRGCKTAHAFYFIDTGKVKEADGLLLELLNSSGNMLKEDRIQIYVAYFVNHIWEIDSRPGSLEAKSMEYQSLIDKVWPDIEFYPVCGNNIVPNLVMLKKLVNVRISYEHLRSTFGNCPQFRKLFK